MLDPDKIEQLLSIVEKARGYPNLQSLHDKAMQMLEEFAKQYGKAKEEEAKKGESQPVESPATPSPTPPPPPTPYQASAGDV